MHLDIDICAEADAKAEQVLFGGMVYTVQTGHVALLSAPYAHGAICLKLLLS